MKKNSTICKNAESPSTNFIRNIIENDIEKGVFKGRNWNGKPGNKIDKSESPPDPTNIRTRFPPEPNGYLHIGHAKSICLNFGLAEEYGGECHLRFDDTNPTTEDEKYATSIIDAVKWLGYEWKNNLYYASDYFDYLYCFAEKLIQENLAYVDSLSMDKIREYRGTLTTPGKNSPYRNRPTKENLSLFREMKEGVHKDGDHVLRLKINMNSPNINMRDPIIYRIRKASHHRTKNKWCIYPLYDYTHCISDALENITHSLCTLEFEDHRPLYKWILEKLTQGNLLATPLPNQYEFSRLNISHVVLSKRKLVQLVEKNIVEGWDDPRMPTILGARRRGYTAEGFRKFAAVVGVSKSDSLIDYSLLEDTMRDSLETIAPRAFAVIDPLKLVIDNYPENHLDKCEAPLHPKSKLQGTRELIFSKELWIERSDFMLNPPKGYFRLSPGKQVRLRYGYVITCSGFEVDDKGKPTVVFCQYHPDSKSGTEGAEKYKVKGNIHWLSVAHCISAEIRLFDRLFITEKPGSSGDFLEEINPDSKKIISGYLENRLSQAEAGSCFQFERHGYFVTDMNDSTPNNPIFNSTVALRNSWNKNKKKAT